MNAIQKLWANPLFSTLFLIVLASTGSVIFAVVVFPHRLFSLSVDLAHHLSLAQALRSELFLSQADRVILNSMFEYPNFSHRVAAVLMNLGVDPVESLNRTGIAAVILSWTLLLVMSARASVTGFLLFVGIGLGLVFSIYPGILIGYEIIANFFYSQAVAEPLFLSFALLCWSLASRQAMWPLALATVLGVVLVAFFHLLPALRLLGVVEMILAITIARLWFDARTIAWPAVASFIACPAAIIFHPSYAAMKKLAENNGSLEFGVPLDVASITTIAVLVLAASICGFCLYIWPTFHRRSASNVDPQGSIWSVAGNAHVLLFLIAASTALVAITQVLQLTFLHAGSEYAVRKHVFGLVTFGLAAVTCVVGSLVDQSIAPPTGLKPSACLRLGFLGAVAVSAFLFLRPSVMDMDRFAEISAAVTKLKPSSGSNGTYPVFASSALPAPSNYLQTVAVLMSPQAPDQNAMSVLRGERISNWGAVSMFVTTEGDPTYDAPECRSASPIKGVVALKPACVFSSRLAPRSLSPGGEIKFEAGASGTMSLISGWWTPEPWGTWSIGSTSVIEVAVPQNIPAEAYQLQLDANAFVVPQSPTRTIKIRVNDGPETRTTFALASASQTITIPLPKPTGASIRLSFNIEDPVSPEDLGLSIDQRQLGIGVKALRLVHALP